MRNFIYICFYLVASCGWVSCIVTSKPTTNTHNTPSNAHTTEDLAMYRQVFPVPPPFGNNATPPVVPTPPTPNNNPTNNTKSTTKTTASPTQHQNPLMDSLLVALYEANKSVKSVQGYRILVYSGTDREEAEKVKGMLEARLQERSELGYDKPNFRVRVGSFVQRLEAYKTLVKIRREFPNAILVVDKINIDARRRR